MAGACCGRRVSRLLNPNVRVSPHRERRMRAGGGVSTPQDAALPRRPMLAPRHDGAHELSSTRAGERSCNDRPLRTSARLHWTPRTSACTEASCRAQAMSGAMGETKAKITIAARQSRLLRLLGASAVLVLLGG